jgi:hypothetical protein
MSLESEIAADFASLALENGVSVTWCEKTFTALASRASNEEQIAIGGFVESPDMRIRALKSEFTTGLPGIGDLIGVDGSVYRVTKVSRHPKSPVVVFTLATADE